MVFADLLRYRGAWIGVAMIWLVLYHLPIPSSNDIIEHIRGLGYCGVDICFFASGIGCYHSLTVDPDSGHFIKRRISKLAPRYLVFMFFWLIFKYLRHEFDVGMAIGNILGIQSFTALGKDFNWYIGAIFLFYLLAPYFKMIIDRASPVKKYLFLLLLLVGSIPFWNSSLFIITATRLPIFYIGMLFMTVCKRDDKVTLKHGVLFGVSFVVGAVALIVAYVFFEEHLWSKGLYWYPFILMTPPMCMAISSIMYVAEKSKLLKKLGALLSLIGDYSFEIFLIHIPLILIGNMFIRRFGLQSVRWAVWLGAMVVLGIGCFVLRRMANFCVWIVSRKKAG